MGIPPTLFLTISMPDCTGCPTPHTIPLVHRVVDVGGTDVEFWSWFLDGEDDGCGINLRACDIGGGWTLDLSSTTCAVTEPDPCWFDVWRFCVSGTAFSGFDFDTCEPISWTGSKTIQPLICQTLCGLTPGTMTVTLTE